MLNQKVIPEILKSKQNFKKANYLLNEFKYNLEKDNVAKLEEYLLQNAYTDANHQSIFNLIKTNNFSAENIKKYCDKLINNDNKTSTLLKILSVTVNNLEFNYLENVHKYLQEKIENNGPDFTLLKEYINILTQKNCPEHAEILQKYKTICFKVDKKLVSKIYNYLEENEKLSNEDINFLTNYCLDNFKDVNKLVSFAQKYGSKMSNQDILLFSQKILESNDPNAICNFALIFYDKIDTTEHQNKILNLSCRNNYLYKYRLLQIPNNKNKQAIIDKLDFPYDSPFETQMMFYKSWNNEVREVLTDKFLKENVKFLDVYFENDYPVINYCAKMRESFRPMLGLILLNI